MKTLFLAWQAPSDRMWFPVGRLDADSENSLYQFRYTQGAQEALTVGFHPMASFPGLDDCYRSSELFPMFKNRVMGRQRRDFASYLASLALDTPDPIEILAVSGGERQTDSFEVFPKLDKRVDGSFRCRFFLHGLRYMSESAQARAVRLLPGEELGVSLELNNPKHGLAIQLTSRNYEFIGWTPRYIVSDLVRAIDREHEVSARVVQINSDDVPFNRRVLVEIEGFFPVSYEPMSDGAFLPMVRN